MVEEKQRLSAAERMLKRLRDPKLIEHLKTAFDEDVAIIESIDLILETCRLYGSPEKPTRDELFHVFKGRIASRLSAKLQDGSKLADAIWNEVERFDCVCREDVWTEVRNVLTHASFELSAHSIPIMGDKEVRYEPKAAADEVAKRSLRAIAFCLFGLCDRTKPHERLAIREPRPRVWAEFGSFETELITHGGPRLLD